MKEWNISPLAIQQIVLFILINFKDMRTTAEKMVDQRPVIRYTQQAVWMYN